MQPLIAQQLFSNQRSAEAMLGIYNVRIDKSHESAVIEPVLNRQANLGEQFLGDITDFLTSVFCQDCAKIDNIALTEEGNIDLSISIKHPFGLPGPGPPSGKNRIDLHLFDVWGSIYTNDGVNMTGSGIRTNPRFLINADGYSGTYDDVIDEIIPTENTHHPFKVMSEDYSDGNFDPESLSTGFTDVLHPSGHNVFEQGSDYKSTHFIFTTPTNQPVEFHLVLTASYGMSSRWDIPVGYPGHRFTPRYFLPRFHRHEAVKIEVSVPDYLNFLTSNDPNQTAQIRVDVWDWQDGKIATHAWDFATSKAGAFGLSSDIEYVAISVPDLTNELIYEQGTSGADQLPRRFTFSVTNENRATPGKYIGVVAAFDELDNNYNLIGFERDGRSPFLYNEIRTYQVFEIEVKSIASTVPDNPVDVTPNGLNGCFRDVIVADQIAYMSAGVLGVMIFDVSDSVSPQFLGSIETDGFAGRMAFDSTTQTLFVADGSRGMAIIDVSNQSNPFLESTFFVAGITDVVDVVLYDQYAYLGDRESGVAVVDVSDREIPVFKGYYSSRPTVVALSLSGSFLYKLDSFDGVEILSLGDHPISPEFVNGLIINGTKRDIVVRNGVAAILLKQRVVTADVTNPYLPALKGTVDITPFGEGIDLVDNYVFVADGTAGVQVISIENMTDPEHIGGYDTPGVSAGVFVVGHDVFVADGDAGLVVLETWNDEIGWGGQYETAGCAWGISLNEKNVYVASGSSGIKSVDIASFGIPQLTGSINTPGFAFDCSANDKALFVADAAQGMAIIDIQNPSQLNYLGNFQFADWESWFLGGIERTGDYFGLYGPQTQPGYPDMILMDGSNPFAPVMVSSIATQSDFFDLAFQSSHIYAASGWDGIITINASDPQSLTQGGTYSNGKLCNSVFWGYGRLYAGFDNMGLEILNPSNPNDLVRIGGYSHVAFPHDVVLSGNYVYTNSSTGLAIIDITSPSIPTLLTELELPAPVSEIIIRGNYAFVGNFEGGLRIIRLWE